MHLKKTKIQVLYKILFKSNLAKAHQRHIFNFKNDKPFFLDSTSVYTRIKN